MNIYSAFFESDTLKMSLLLCIPSKTKDYFLVTGSLMF